MPIKPPRNTLPELLRGHLLTDVQPHDDVELLLVTGLSSAEIKDVCAPDAIPTMTRILNLQIICKCMNLPDVELLRAMVWPGITFPVKEVGEEWAPEPDFHPVSLGELVLLSAPWLPAPIVPLSEVRLAFSPISQAHMTAYAAKRSLPLKSYQESQERAVRATLLRDMKLLKTAGEKRGLKPEEYYLSLVAAQDFLPDDMNLL